MFVRQHEPEALWKRLFPLTCRTSSICIRHLYAVDVHLEMCSNGCLCVSSFGLRVSDSNHGKSLCKQQQSQRKETLIGWMKICIRSGAGKKKCRAQIDCERVMHVRGEAFEMKSHKSSRVAPLSGIIIWTASNRCRKKAEKGWLDDDPIRYDAEDFAVN